jgi:CarboxypepD_reg-like domain
MAKLILFFSFLLFVIQAYSQTYLISGEVVNKSTDELLVGCSVYNVTKQRGTITNEEGKYRITADKGDLVQFTYIGMAIIEQYIVDNSDLNITMTYQAKRIKNVVIKSDNLARNSVLFNPKYDKQKNIRTREGEHKTANQKISEAGPSVTGAGVTMSPISMLYYAFNKRERRRLDAIVDINHLDASNQKYSLDFISLVTKVEDLTELKDIKAYCYFPHDRILKSSFYDLGLMLQDCYIEYLEDKKIHPKMPSDSTKMDW